jgi:hypothetical protein
MTIQESRGLTQSLNLLSVRAEGGTQMSPQEKNHQLVKCDQVLGS